MDAERRIPVEFAAQPEQHRELEAAIGKVKRGLGRKVPQAMILEVRGPVRLQSATGVNKPAVPGARESGRPPDAVGRRPNPAGLPGGLPQGAAQIGE